MERKENCLYASAIASQWEVAREKFTEREVIACAVLPKVKQGEHLAGVLALRRALTKLYSSISTVEVLRQHDAPPIVLIDGETLSSSTVGVSHSHGVGIAAIVQGTHAIGVDIQSSEKFTLSSEQFFSYEELSQKVAQDPVLVWTYKEALLKALRMGLRVHPKRVSLALDEASNLLGARVDNIPLLVTGMPLESIPGLISVLVVLHDDLVYPQKEARIVNHYE